MAQATGRATQSGAAASCFNLFLVGNAHILSHDERHLARLELRRAGEAIYDVAVDERGTTERLILQKERRLGVCR